MENLWCAFFQNTTKFKYKAFLKLGFCHTEFHAGLSQRLAPFISSVGVCT